VLADFGGIPPSLLAVARVRRALIAPLTVRVTVAGLGTQARLDAAEGSATVTRDLGLVELVASPWPNAVVHPVASLGAGTLYASVDGQANPPYVGRQSDSWAVAFDAGAGAQARLGRRFALAIEAHALLAQPYPVVEFAGVNVARALPSILTSLSVVGWL